MDLILKILLILVSGLFVSCEFINPDEPIPSYLYIPDIQFTNDPNTQGSATSKITDAWVDIDDQFVGVYELPATIPLLNVGSPKITVRAGILDDGISSTRARYPFYSNYELNTTATDILLKAGTVDTLAPVVNYKDSADFRFMEDFETSFIDFETINGDIEMTAITGSDALEGQSVIITLTADDPFYEGASTESFALPDLDIPIYLELDYKCNNPFQIGIMGITGSNLSVIYKVAVNPKSNWNKIYVRYRESVTNLQASKYKIMLRAQKSDNISQARIYLDNFKLLTF